MDLLAYSCQVIVSEYLVIKQSLIKECVPTTLIRLDGDLFKNHLVALAIFQFEVNM